MTACRYAGRRLPIFVTLGCLLLSAAPSPSAQGQERPVTTSLPSPDGPLPVTLGMHIVDITSISELDNTFSVELEVVGSWDDPRLAFEGSLDDERVFVGPAAIQEHARIWSPQINAINGVGNPTLGRMRLTERSDGRVEYRVRINALLRGPLDFHAFPFDTQVLPIHLESFSWNQEAVLLIEALDHTGFDPDFELPDWNIESVRTSETEASRFGHDVPFSRLSLEIEVHRKLGFYVWKVFIPVFLIVAMSWVVFWMSGDPMGRRAGVSITGILTLIAYQFIVSESLPRIPYLTELDKIMLISVVMVAGTMFINIIVGRPGAERFRVVDRICRWAFPVIYLTGSAIVLSRNLLT